MKKLAILTALALLAGSAAAQQTRPTSNIEATLINTDPAPIQSGEDAEITFKLVNTGNTEAENVKVRLVDSFPFQIKPGRQKNYSLGDMSPGQEYQISTEVLVADDAPDGQNSFKIRVSNGDFSVTREVDMQVQSQDIELNLANLKTSPNQLTPDIEDAQMDIELVNNGEKTAENVVLEIGLPEAFQETSSFSTRQALGNIKPGEVKSASFNFDIEDAETGETRIPANITYSTGDSSSRITEESGFSFHLAGKPQFKVTDVESDLRAGETGELRVTVENTGAEQSSSTRIRVLDSSDQPFSYSSASQYIGTLEPGQTGTAVFDVTAESSAEVKQYLIDFEIRGKKDTAVYVEEETVQIGVQEGSRGTNPIIPVAVALVVLGGLYYFRDRIRELIGR